MGCFFFFQAEDGIRDGHVTGVQTCALPISSRAGGADGSATHVLPSTTKVYVYRPGGRGTLTLHTPCWFCTGRSGVSLTFQSLKSPTTDTRLALGATKTK